MTPYNRAEEIEKIVKNFASLLLVLAFLFLSNAIEGIYGEAVDPYMDYVQKPLAILTLILAIPTVARSIKIKRQRTFDIFEEGGYMGAMFQKAAARAFIVTYAITVLLAALNNKVLSHLTAEDLAYIVLTYSLAAFSIVFFILTRTNSDDAAEDEE
jgi:hypothetical protein